MKMANANENNADEYDFVESMRRRFQYSHRRFRLMLEMFGEIELIEKSYKHYENVLLEILQQSKVSATAALEIKHLMGRFGKLLTDTFLPLNRRYFDNLNNTVTDKDVDADMELCARNLQSFLTILGQSIERLLDSFKVIEPLATASVAINQNSTPSRTASLTGNKQYAKPTADMIHAVRNAAATTSAASNDTPRSRGPSPLVVNQVVTTAALSARPGHDVEDSTANRRGSASANEINRLSTDVDEKIEEYSSDEEDYVDYEGKISEAGELNYMNVLDRSQPEMELKEFQRTDKDSRMVDKLLTSIAASQQHNSRRYLKVHINNRDRLVEAMAQSQQSRSKIEAQKYKKWPDKSNQAAALIQRIYRGHLTRRHYKNMTLRKLIVSEILETEFSYVRGLLTVYRSHMLAAQHQFDIGQPVMLLEEFSTVFFHVREILLLNAGLLGKIHKRTCNWNMWTCIGDIFLDFTPELEMYTHYVNNYNKALVVYQHCRREPKFREFLDQIKAKQEKRSLDLADLLITPVQRVPRYLLLLKELLKRTEKKHEDYRLIEQSIEILQKVAGIINERKRESERFNATFHAQEKILNLPFALVNPDRFLIHEGELWEITETGKKKHRRVFIFNDLIVCAQIQKAGMFSSGPGEQFEFRWARNVNGLVVRQMQNPAAADMELPDGSRCSDLGIGLIGEDLHVFVTSSNESLQDWMIKLNEARIAMGTLMKTKSLRATNERTLSGHLFNLAIIDPTVDSSIKDTISARDAIKLTRERSTRLLRELKEEKKILGGLQRLDYVYAVQNPRAQGKLMSQKQQSSALIDRLESSYSRCLALTGYLETLADKNALLDRKELSKSLE